jgi:LmbE family N-acetylglucosaminyl deacetylase
MRICLLTIVLLVVALVFVLERILSRLEPTAVHPVFYIFAHPDDMVLFMASNVLMDARRAGNRVIAIQVCAGDGSVEWPDEWWQAREHGIDLAMRELTKEYTAKSMGTQGQILNSVGANTNTYVFPDSNYFRSYLFNDSRITRGPNETHRELADVIEGIIMIELIASGQLSRGPNPASNETHRD